MSITKKIKNKINKLPKNKAFTTNHLRHLGKADTVRKVLGRMVTSGEIERVSRGTYVKKGPSKKPAELLAPPIAVMESIAETTGEVICIHGAEAARRLRLTTQVPLQLVLYTTGRSRTIKIHQRNISLRHISHRKLVSPGSTSCTVILALWYLGKHNVTTNTIEKIRLQLTPREFSAVLKNISRMPAWMANSFYQHQSLTE